MIIAWVKRIESSKYTRWLVAVAFLLLVLAVILDGQLWIIIEALLVVLGIIGSARAGIVVGGPLARMINRQLLKQSAAFGKGLAAALSVFGFLFFPPLIASWTNTYLNTGIEMQSLGAHFLWACIAGALFFVIASSGSEY